MAETNQKHLIVTLMVPLVRASLTVHSQCDGKLGIFCCSQSTCFCNNVVSCACACFFTWSAKAFRVISSPSFRVEDVSTYSACGSIRGASLVCFQDLWNLSSGKHTYRKYGGSHLETRLSFPPKKSCPLISIVCCPVFAVGGFIASTCITPLFTTVEEQHSCTRKAGPPTVTSGLQLHHVYQRAPQPKRMHCTGLVLCHSDIGCWLRPEGCGGPQTRPQAHHTR